MIPPPPPSFESEDIQAVHFTSPGLCRRYIRCASALAVHAHVAEYLFQYSPGTSYQ